MEGKLRHFIYPINSDDVQNFRDCKDSFEFEGQDSKLPIAHRMLNFPWRNYVIKKIKAPLEKAIKDAKRITEMAPALVNAAALLHGKFGAITKENTLYPNTHCLIEHKARFLSYETNRGKAPMLAAAFDIAAAENEHDNYYQTRLNVEIEFIIEDILAGKWEPRPLGQPHQYWNEPSPYGGKHSIIYKLREHREEILKIIREEE